MTPAEQNRAIAQWMGWTKIRTGYPMDGIKPGSVGALRHLIPNFHGDLNAIHEAEDHYAVVVGEMRSLALAIEKVITGHSEIQWPSVFASPAQRCEALLRTLGLWKEGE